MGDKKRVKSWGEKHGKTKAKHSEKKNMYRQLREDVRIIETTVQPNVDGKIGEYTEVVVFTAVLNTLFFQSSFVTFQLNSFRGFYPQRPSGQGHAVVTGVFPRPPPPPVRAFIYRAQGSAFPLFSFFMLVDFHPISRTNALALSAKSFLDARKSLFIRPRACTREDSNPRD